MNPDYIRVNLCDFCEREAARDSDYCDHHSFVWFGVDHYGNELRETVWPCNVNAELADLANMSLVDLLLWDIADDMTDATKTYVMRNVTVLHPADWPTFSFPSPLPSYYPTTER